MPFLAATIAGSKSQAARQLLGTGPHDRAASSRLSWTNGIFSGATSPVRASVSRSTRLKPVVVRLECRLSFTIFSNSAGSLRLCEGSASLRASAIERLLDITRQRHVSSLPGEDVAATIKNLGIDWDS
jgi:hypothetical protein